MDPEIENLEKELKEAFSLLKTEDLGGIRTAEIMLAAKRASAKAGRRAVPVLAVSAALACSAALAVLLLRGHSAPAAAGDNTVYIEGVHEMVYGEGRVVVFRNPAGDLVESKKAQPAIDLDFEGVLASVSVSNYFETGEEKEKRLYGLLRLYGELKKEKGGESKN